MTANMDIQQIADDEPDAAAPLAPQDEPIAAPPVTDDARGIVEALSKPFDPRVIQSKPGGNRRPDVRYVSHGSVTKRLNQVCPGWTSRVVEIHAYYEAQSGKKVCAGVQLELTIPGVGSRQEFGTANQPRSFGDDVKNAMSDALKRCAMRFGVALDLWEEMDEGDEDAAPIVARRDAAQGRYAREPEGRYVEPRQQDPPRTPRNPDAPASEGQRKMIYALARECGLDAEEMQTWIGELTDGRTSTSKDLTMREAGSLISLLQARKATRG